MREIDKEKKIQKCCNCNEWKDLNLFPKNKRMKFGIDTTCKECTNNRSKKHYTENKEKKKEYQNEYYKEHRKERLDYKNKYYKKNKERILEWFKEYEKDPKRIADRIKARTKYRSKLKEFDTDITAEFLTNLWEETQTCEICEKELTNKKNAHLDHIIPLNIGGEHMSYNVRYICASCNVSRPKNGSDLIEKEAI